MRYLLRITMFTYLSIAGLIGCDNTDDIANNNKGEGIAIPVAITTAALPAGDLIANLYIDNEQIATRVVDANSQNAVRFNDIPVASGTHTFTVEFMYQSTIVPLIILASANATRNVTPGVPTTWTINNGDYTFADDDEDKISNIIEIENESDPKNADDVPSRVSQDLISLYNFQQAADGSVVSDVSKVGEPLNLTIQDVTKTSWLDGGGLSIIAGPDPLNPGTQLSSGMPATKIIEAVKASNEITVEFWAKPDNTIQIEQPDALGLARVVTISQSSGFRNMTVGQNGAQYVFRLRSSVTDNNAVSIIGARDDPVVRSPADTVTVDLTHVVVTHAAGTRKLYINNVLSGELVVGGDFSNWDNAYELALANEFIGARPWLGELYMVAIYSRALNATEILLNNIAGVEVEVGP